MDQRTLCALPRDDVHPLVAALECGLPAREQKMAFRFLPRMTPVAGVGQDRLDVPAKVDLHGDRGR